MTTLVLGGTGKTGRRIVQRLQARGVAVRIGSRAGHPPYEWSDRAGWRAALDGVDAVYVSHQPDLATPGAAEAVRGLAELAAHTGVRRLVLLSRRGVEDAQLGEKALQSYGADWTVLRCSWFNQNFSEGLLLDAVRTGRVAVPAGAEPFVDADDVADVAVEVLADDRHVYQTYELTGPRPLTFPQAVAEIAATTGRDLFVPDPPHISDTSDPSDPSDTSRLFGRDPEPTDGIERLLDRPARDFSDFTRITSASGSWN